LASVELSVYKHFKKNMLPLFFKVSQKDNGHGAANAAGFGWRNGG
jgi:hypothetical protein